MYHCICKNNSRISDLKWDKTPLDYWVTHKTLEHMWKVSLGSYIVSDT